ncbi:hypothetical protein [Blastococcus deserti]|uniref:Uncharacterized protein n=1 Tax=Blastococcus deserti TaxID=2259033 RepID=A0ABW4XBE6_9ACTN
MHGNHLPTPDAASIVASRQLAEEARRRRLLPELRRRRRPLVVPPLPTQRPPQDPGHSTS